MPDNKGAGVAYSQKRSTKARARPTVWQRAEAQTQTGSAPQQTAPVIGLTGRRASVESGLLKFLSQKIKTLNPKSNKAAPQEVHLSLSKLRDQSLQEIVFLGLEGLDLY